MNEKYSRRHWTIVYRHIGLLNGGLPLGSSLERQICCYFIFILIKMNQKEKKLNHYYFSLPWRLYSITYHFLMLAYLNYDPIPWIVLKKKEGL